MNKLAKIFLLVTLLSQSIFALGNTYYQEKFNATKKLYLGAIMSNEKQKEIDYLKKLVRYGNKLNVNTSNYKKELKRLNTSTTSKNIPKIVFTKKTKKTTSKKTQKKSKSNTPLLHEISSVTQIENKIIIKFNEKINASYINFTEKRVRKLHYDTFEIKGNFKDASPTKLKIPGVTKISIYQKRKNKLLLDFKHSHNLKTIYIISKSQIIIKVLDLNIKKEKKKSTTKKKNQSQIQKIKPQKIQTNLEYIKDRIIVIDAGHGGRDGGANYKRKRFEKDITLRISKYLKKELERKGFKVYLTRSKDKYVKLSKRTKYANHKHADIFLSIHANAARKDRASKAYGIESYFLSPARSARAKRVAALENKGDMTGMGWSSKNSLLTILNQAKITAANKMAIDIQKNMLFTLRKSYGTKNIRDGGVREGPFWVLVGAQMPSVLIEVGYISHPKEGYRISTSKYQKEIAKGIAKGVESYFIKNIY